MILMSGLFKKLLYVVIALVVLTALIIYVQDVWRYSDDAANRGVAIVDSNALHVNAKTPVAPDDGYTKSMYVDQGWNTEESLWFYNVTQGSDLLPYDFFMVLRQACATKGGKPNCTVEQKLFRDNDNINAYRYLPQVASESNPDGLPVGFVKDTYTSLKPVNEDSDIRYTDNTEFVGPTCAACHTSQIDYDGLAIRIDGGPAMSDMDSFMRGIGDALVQTLQDDTRKALFVKEVLARDNYASEEEVMIDLERFSLRMNMYNGVNHVSSESAYGYGRLDAFGRIYNRTAEHLLTTDRLRDLLSTCTPEQKKANYCFDDAQVDTILHGMTGLLSAIEREAITARSIIQYEANGVSKFGTTKAVYTKLQKKIYNTPDAPVSYPFLWDIVQHDYVQWNGIADNAGVGPIGRNAGEVIGVFGTLDWHKVKDGGGTFLTNLIGGQNPEELVSYRSSVDVHNLRLIEDQLGGLQSPEWPTDILGEHESAEVLAEGKRHYETNCVSCHHDIDRSSDTRRVIANFTRVDTVGTDPAMAENSVAHTAYSGIVENLYLGVGVGDILLQEREPVAALLTKVTVNVVATPDMDKNFITRWTERVGDFIAAIRDNTVKGSIKRGDYVADSTVDPWASLVAYKGRPLNGIWATAPFLHNGSVPNLYDLLLPSKCLIQEEKSGACVNPADGEMRPSEFVVGSREYDPVKAGFQSTDYDGFVFTTREKIAYVESTKTPGTVRTIRATDETRVCNGSAIPTIAEYADYDDGYLCIAEVPMRANSNSGHEYAAGRTPLVTGGETLPALNKAQRHALLSYIKTL
ncbi:MAG: hypothetical protein ACI8XX_001656 [Polaribacter sp.]|jgi:hypothetical protein